MTAAATAPASSLLPVQSGITAAASEEASAESLPESNSTTSARPLTEGQQEETPDTKLASELAAAVGGSSEPTSPDGGDGASGAVQAGGAAVDETEAPVLVVSATEDQPSIDAVGEEAEGEEWADRLTWWESLGNIQNENENMTEAERLTEAVKEAADVNLTSQSQHFPTANTVWCMCRSSPHDYACGGMYYSLHQCSRQCYQACKHHGLGFSGCAGSRSIRWHSHLGHRFSDCSDSPMDMHKQHTHR